MIERAVLRFYRPTVVSDCWQAPDFPVSTDARIMTPYDTVDPLVRLMRKTCGEYPTKPICIGAESNLVAAAGEFVSGPGRENEGLKDAVRLRFPAAYRRMPKHSPGSQKLGPN